MELPPVEVRRAVIQRLAVLHARLPGEFGEPPLVLPNGTFFPDTFRPDQTSVKKLVRRMQGHAGLDDVPIQVVLVGDPGEAAASSCNSGACCSPKLPVSDATRLLEAGDSWRLHVPEAELPFPVVMTANVARALGLVFLLETAEGEADIEAPVDATMELAAVGLGLGVLLLQASYMYQKSCGGPSVSQVTTLSVGELAIATALFARTPRGATKPGCRDALPLLDPTQHDLLREADAWVQSNPALVDLFAQRPEVLAAGSFETEETRPWLFRLFGQRKRSQLGERLAAGEIPEDATLEELEAATASFDGPPPRRASREENARRKQLRSLVDEAFVDEGLDDRPAP